MSGESGIPTSGFGDVRFTLKVQNVNIEVSAQLPEGPVSPTVLLPVLRSLSDSLCNLSIRAAAQMGERLSCREGCAACCRHAVPISPAEAREISHWLDDQCEERQATLRERFRQTATQLEESGIAQAVREAAKTPDRPTLHDLGLKYFSLWISCPFLEDERCIIHEIRPMRCREYLVVSPAEHCSHPETKQIVSVKQPVSLSQIASGWDANGDARTPELIVLTMLDEWVAQHPPRDDRAHRTAPELLQEFLHTFASDAQAAPAVAGGGIEPAQ
jgi:Fe-S-cluster containining protein